MVGGHIVGYVWAIDDARDDGQCAPPPRGIRRVPKDAPRCARLATTPCPPLIAFCAPWGPHRGGGEGPARPEGVVAASALDGEVPEVQVPVQLVRLEPRRAAPEGVGMGQASAMMFSVMCRIGNNRNTIIRIIKNASKKTRKETNNAIPGTDRKGTRRSCRGTPAGGPGAPLTPSPGARGSPRRVKSLSKRHSGMWHGGAFAIKILRKANRCRPAHGQNPVTVKLVKSDAPGDPHFIPPGVAHSMALCRQCIAPHPREWPRSTRTGRGVR